MLKKMYFLLTSYEIDKSPLLEVKYGMPLSQAQILYNWYIQKLNSNFLRDLGIFFSKVFCKFLEFLIYSQHATSPKIYLYNKYLNECYSLWYTVAPLQINILQFYKILQTRWANASIIPVILNCRSYFICRVKKQTISYSCVPLAKIINCSLLVLFSYVIYIS